MSATILQGDCIERMAEMEESSVAAIVCDPPYGLGFMGKKWDDLPPGLDFAREALRVLRPGGHLLAFGGTRTYHRLACAIEDAGFEIRDSLLWLYGSGFPKSLDVSKAIDKAAGIEREVVGPPTRHGGGTNGVYAQDEWTRENQATMGARTAPATSEATRWDGWGTALKPAHEPIVVARKPLIGTVAANVLEHGTGGLNIDASRLDAVSGGPGTTPAAEKGSGRTLEGGEIERQPYDGAAGRFPANVVLSHTDDCVPVGTTTLSSDGHYPASGGKGKNTYGHRQGYKGDERHTAGETVEAWECAPGCPVAELDAQSGVLKSGFMAAGTEREGIGYQGGLGNRVRNDTHGDAGGASRFFYQAKTSRAERNAGLEGSEAKALNWSSGEESPGTFQSEGTDRSAANFHPTVKPIDLMRWLVRLVTPPGGTIVDAFLGSGTTGCAAVLEGFDFIGIEREPEYIAIAEARIAFWSQHVGKETADVLKAHRKHLAKRKRDVGQGELLEAAA